MSMSIYSMLGSSQDSASEPQKQIKDETPGSSSSLKDTTTAQAPSSAAAAGSADGSAIQPPGDSQAPAPAAKKTSPAASTLPTPSLPSIASLPQLNPQDHPAAAYQASGGAETSLNASSKAVGGGGVDGGGDGPHVHPQQYARASFEAPATPTTTTTSSPLPAQKTQPASHSPAISSAPGTSSNDLTHEQVLQQQSIVATAAPHIPHTHHHHSHSHNHLHHHIMDPMYPQGTAAYPLEGPGVSAVASVAGPPGLPGSHVQPLQQQTTPQLLPQQSQSAVPSPQRHPTSSPAQASPVPPQTTLGNIAVTPPAGPMSAPGFGNGGPVVVAGPYLHHGHGHTHGHSHSHMHHSHVYSSHNHHTHTHTHTHGALVSGGNLVGSANNGSLTGGGIYGAYTGTESVVVSNIQVYDAIKYFPRHSLGVVMYRPISNEVEEELEEVRMMEDELEGYPNAREATRRCVSGGLPSLEGHENSVLHVRIARQYLSRATNMGVQERRLWGTDIYTDDSDVVAVLYHMGFLPPKSNYSEAGMGEAQGQDRNDATSAGLQAELDGDCVVTLVALPRLERYVGSYRNGLYSRTWARVPHDGASFQVVSVNFVSRGSGPFETNCAVACRGRAVGGGLDANSYRLGGGYGGGGNGESNGCRVAAWMDEFRQVFEDTAYGGGGVGVSHTREDRYPGIQWRARTK